MVSKKNVQRLLVSAVALSVAGAAGATYAGMTTAPSNPALIKVGQSSCNAKMNCSSAMDKDVAADAKEKCYGVVKAGANDCANANKSHSCAGQATTDGDMNEWVAVPAGVCAKLVGGSSTPPGEAQ